MKMLRAEVDRRDDVRLARDSGVIPKGPVLAAAELRETSD
jgi:hypothetical protein